MVPMRAQKRKEAFHEPRLHRDNCLLQVQHRIVLASSWFRCAIVRSWKLSMNQLTERGQPCPHESNPRNSRTRLSALLSVAGSWSLCAVGKTWELSMNLKVVCLQS